MSQDRIALILDKAVEIIKRTLASGMVWIRDFYGQGYSATPVLLRPFRKVYHFKRFKTNRLRAAPDEITPPAHEYSV